MELEQLKSYLTNIDDLRNAIISEKPQSKELNDLIAQYDIDNHIVMDSTKRKDKTVKISETETKIEPVIRIPIPYQREIVRMAAAFLCGNPIELNAHPDGKDEENLLKVLKKTWTDNKLDYESKRLAKLMMSECECAELWYTEKADDNYWNNTPLQGSKYRLRMRVVAPSLGDTLYPVYNMTGDMVAFGRSYFISVNGKNVERFDVYMADQNVFMSKKEGNWTIEKEEKPLVPIGKIPVIYYSQDRPEWAEVQKSIERMEESISDHGDTNKYFGFPMLVAKGTINGFAAKGENGKLLELTGEGSDVKTISWDRSPESVKLEQENLNRIIHQMTSTPDVSFESMRSIGAMSGIALKLLFLGAHLKAADKEENFGKSVQRRINFLLAALAKINVGLEKGLTLSVKPKFEYFLPKNDQESIQVLTEAVTGKILSQKTAVNLNPLVEDKEAEEQQLKDEAESAGALQQITEQQI